MTKVFSAGMTESTGGCPMPSAVTSRLGRDTPPALQSILVSLKYPVDAPSQGRQRLRAGRHQMFLSTVNGRYWVELMDQVTADWESLRMNHAIAKEFREAMRTRTVVPSVTLASARFFSLRTRNADPVSTAMTLK